MGGTDPAPLPEGYCVCEFTSVTEKREALKNMLRKFGDGILEMEIDKAVSCDIEPVT